MSHPTVMPPGTEAPTRFRPKLRYELIGCGLHGHELVGTDAAHVGADDALVVQDSHGFRWYRCLRCDSWLPLPPPDHPARDRPPSREEIELPLRGRPLRDRYVLRLISLERVIHFAVLAVITVAIFLFAHDRARLHSDYTRILADLQGGLGGPINDNGKGIFSDLDRLFALSTTKLYLAGAATGAYALVMAAEAFGLWWAQRWAEYLTFVETGVLVPVEIYELVSRVSPLKVVTLVINLAVVIYLLLSKRLFGLRGGGRAEQAERDADSDWGALERATPYLVVPPPATAGHATGEAATGQAATGRMASRNE